jgi:hypothetical protein
MCTGLKWSSERTPAATCLLTRSKTVEEGPIARYVHGEDSTLRHAQAFLEELAMRVLRAWKVSGGDAEMVKGCEELLGDGLAARVNQVSL